MPCNLTGDCCWVEGSRCEFLTDDRLCGLMLEHGDWKAVHADQRWLESPIGRVFARVYPGFGCGDYPQNIPGAPGCCMPGAA
jgi:hypothetical protein